MVLLGSKAPARNTEQHDFFFGIAHHLADLLPDMKAFWPEAGKSLHIDGWRKITSVNGYRVQVLPKQNAPEDSKRLFFINLGGYTAGKLEEQHYTLLTVQDDRISALSASKQTVFFKSATIAGLKEANAHIDEKYGIDVDDIYRIDDLLSPADKAAYHINLSPAPDVPEDEIHLGYLQLHKLL